MVICYNVIDLRLYLSSLKGIEADEDGLKLFFDQVPGKDITELVTVGREKLAFVSSGGAVAVASAPAAGGGGGVTAAEKPKEEKVEEEEESDYKRIKRSEPNVKGTIVFDASSTITLSPVNFQYGFEHHWMKT